ncbi:MAG: carbon-nitrogen hydrolase family protein [Methanomassiliicoccales archaeon]|nr:MAG: carbon-nitrogen hydrolase family protein [Methanomassiliicoccales archaeon]
MKIALAQLRCALADKEVNVAKMGKLIGEQDADLFVFCELYLTGYMVRDRINSLAEPLHGPSVRKIERLAEEHDCAILFGMARLDDDLPNILRNSAVMVSEKEGVQVYDKQYPATFGPFEEGLYFGAGDGPVMMTHKGFRLGIEICYDIFHSEIARTHALSGAEALITISASPYTSRDFFERIVPARAIENTVYSIYVNQVGAQLGMVFFGGSEAYGPRGDRLAKCRYFDEDVKVIEIDRHDLELARRGRPTIRDGDAMLRGV